MKITEATTLAELQAYLSTLGHPSLTVVLGRRGYQANVYLQGVGSFSGDGNTYAEAIEAALAELRAAIGVTNLAYEPLNYVRERSSLLSGANKFRQHANQICRYCGCVRSEHPGQTNGGPSNGCLQWEEP